MSDNDKGIIHDASDERVKAVEYNDEGEVVGVADFESKSHTTEQLRTVADHIFDSDDEDDIQNGNWLNDQLEEGDIVYFDSRYEFTLSDRIYLNTPGIRVFGLRARLSDSDLTTMVTLNEDNIEFAHFDLDGNQFEHDPDESRESMVFIGTNTEECHVHDGIVRRATRHGIHLTGSPEGPVKHNTVEKIWGYENNRDVVSLEGSSAGEGGTDYNTVENIWCFDSTERGAVEIADGCIGTTVEKIRAFNSNYALDHEDHGEDQENDKSLVRDVRAVDCDYTIRTNANASHHGSLVLEDIWGDAPIEARDAERITIRNVVLHDPSTSGIAQEGAIQSENVDHLSLENVKIVGGPSHDSLRLTDIGRLTTEGLEFGGRLRLESIDRIDCQNTVASRDDGVSLRLDDCHNATFQGVETAGRIATPGDPSTTIKFEGLTVDGFGLSDDIIVLSDIDGLVFENLSFKNLGADADQNGLRMVSCDDVKIDGVVFEDGTETPDALNGVRFDNDGQGIFVHNVRAYDWGVGDNIRIADSTSDYIVTHNIADVDDQVGDSGSIVADNITP